MHRRLLVALLLLVCALALSSIGIARLAAEEPDKTAAVLGGGPENITLTKEEQQFVDLTNASRKEQGAPPLTVAPLLVKVAREKSQEMHDLNYWGHESPNKDKRTAMRRVLFHLPQKPVSMVVGENLYYCSQPLVEEGHQALLNSPTHRRNIMNPDYQYIGIGAFKADDGRFWVTEIFLKAKF